MGPNVSAMENLCSCRRAAGIEQEVPLYEKKLTGLFNRQGMNFVGGDLYALSEHGPEDVRCIPGGLLSPPASATTASLTSRGLS